MHDLDLRPAPEKANRAQLFSDLFRKLNATAVSAGATDEALAEGFGFAA